MVDHPEQKFGHKLWKGVEKSFILRNEEIRQHVIFVLPEPGGRGGGEEAGLCVPHQHQGAVLGQGLRLPASLVLSLFRQGMYQLYIKTQTLNVGFP
jgi:hypothetical protein